MDLETFGLNVSHKQHTFKQVFYYENSLPFPAHSCLEFIRSGGGNEGDYWPWDEFSISSTPDWSYSNLQIFLVYWFLSLSRSLFTLQHACSIPQGPPWCPRLWRNSSEHRLPPIPPPSLSNHMFMIRWAWHDQAFISFSMETLISPASTCNLSILEFLKGV